MDVLVALVAAWAATTECEAWPLLAATSFPRQRAPGSISDSSIVVSPQNGYQWNANINLEENQASPYNWRSRRKLMDYWTLDDINGNNILQKNDFLTLGASVNDLTKMKANIPMKHKIFQYEYATGLRKLQTLNKEALSADHRVFKRSPLELGLVHGISSTNHQVTHHGNNAHTSTHHNLVIHPPKLAAAPQHHVVQISSLHDVDGLVTHAVIDPGLHITSTTVITHDKPLAVVAHPIVTAAAHTIVAADHPLIEHHEVEVIPVVVKHEVLPVVAKAAIVVPHAGVSTSHDIFRTHVGGFGVGLDFGGHGAGHGFYASTGFGFR